MLMIRLARFGAKKKPTYRLVVIEKERARNSRAWKWSGIIIRSRKPKQLHIKHERIDTLVEERRAAVRYGEAPARRIIRRLQPNLRL